MRRKKKIVGWKKLIPTGTERYDKNITWAFKNNIYTVFAKVAEKSDDCEEEGESPEPVGVLRLSIKRNDRGVAGNASWFRDFVLIKNEIVGPKTHALQVIAAESELKDAANQYHLSCIRPDVELPPGLLLPGGRAVADPGIKEERDLYTEDAVQKGYDRKEAEHILKTCKQEPFQEHHLPENVPTHGWMKWDNYRGWHSSFFLANDNGECQLVLEPGEMTEEQQELVKHLIIRGSQ
tara:strand:+ start:49 stop:756 length:708 start_codon:yes stop_codon:yes gene_type:complete